MKKPKLLVVEDDFETQSFMKIFFRNDYEATFVDSEATFRDAFNSTDFDLILMDIALPEGKNGIELTREIKSNPQTAKIPVICLTAHAFLKDRTNAIEAGVDYFLTKPVDNQVLKNILKQYSPKY